MNLSDLSNPLPIEYIDFRIQSINKGGYATILAYKNARVDMNILDEYVGPENWQKDYKIINNNLFCGIGIKNEGEWIWKWDVGVESYSEKEKGQASDSFKRAGFCWGIGRELYDYPTIIVKLNADEFTVNDNKAKQTYNLKIKEWRWVSQFDHLGNLSCLAAKDQNDKLRFKFGEYVKNR